MRWRPGWAPRGGERHRGRPGAREERRRRQGSENIKADRATVSGQNGPGADPPNDRRIPLDPSFFDYQTLNRFGK